MVDAAKRVIPSAHYSGLSFQTATESRAYLHYRQPESLQGEKGGENRRREGRMVQNRGGGGSECRREVRMVESRRG